jgi:serine/threonine-protein kinase
MEAERRRVAEVLTAYEVGREIGRGAWGVVYAGLHRHLARDVAIKQLPTAFSADPTLRARFVREARLVASLDHPHIVPVYDYVERDGFYLIVMEHLSGGTLWQRFNGPGVALDEAVALTLAVCAALGYAHERNILHRDVKPENLLLTAGGLPKLTDFGIAKLLTSTMTAVTVAGTVVGTPAYMAPEQAQGGEIGPATDVYACAVLLYELLVGRLPFPDTPSPVAQLYQHVNEVPRSLREAAPAAPAGLCDVVMRALAKSPADRYRTGEEFGVALARAATDGWGPGWLQRTDVTVMDRGRIGAATQWVESTGRRLPAPATVVVRRTGLDHPVLVPWPDARAPDEDVAGLAARPPAPPTAPPPLSLPPPLPMPGPGVLAPLPPVGRRDVGRRPRRSVAVGLAGAALVAVVVTLVVVLVRRGGDPPSAPGSGSPTVTEAPRVPGRSVEIDDIGREGDRYVVLYTAYDFTPRIDEQDPTKYHVHFFWDVYRPEQAGRNAPDHGAAIGQWELWDQRVFDGFTEAERPPGAMRICAVVGTHDHRVDDPGRHSCADLPS